LGVPPGEWDMKQFSSEELALLAAIHANPSDDNRPMLAIVLVILTTDPFSAANPINLDTLAVPGRSPGSRLPVGTGSSGSSRVRALDRPEAHPTNESRQSRTDEDRKRIRADGSYLPIQRLRERIMG